MCIVREEGDFDAARFSYIKFCRNSEIFFFLSIHPSFIDYSNIWKVKEGPMVFMLNLICALPTKVTDVNQN